MFEHFNRFRVLSALRNGPFGVEALNGLCEAALRDRGLIQSRRDWYPGRPVMIVRNDYNLRLFNGDIGITLPDPDDPERMRVFSWAVTARCAVSPRRVCRSTRPSTR